MIQKKTDAACLYVLSLVPDLGVMVENDLEVAEQHR